MHQFGVAQPADGLHGRILTSSSRKDAAHILDLACAECEISDPVLFTDNVATVSVNSSQ